jgi:rhamnosyltransferase
VTGSSTAAAAEPRVPPGVVAGIVTFHPSVDGLRDTLGVLLPQVDHVVLVDNGSDNAAEIAALAGEHPNVELIANGENRGIAAALNELLSWAEEHTVEWVLTLDQDSTPSPDLVPLLVRHTDAPGVAMIGPRILDMNSSLPAPNVHGVHPVAQCITSGALTSVRAAKRVGRFDEAMFIDLVDFEFCARLRDAGFSILVDEDAILHHQLGVLDQRSILGWRVQATNHSPTRVYYWARNLLYFHRKNPRAMTRRHVAADVAYKVATVVAWERDRGAKLAALWAGLRDGRTL